MYAFTYVLIELFCIGIFLMFIFNLDSSVVRHRDVLLFRSAIIAAILYGVIDIVWLLNEIEFQLYNKRCIYFGRGTYHILLDNLYHNKDSFLSASKQKVSNSLNLSLYSFHCSCFKLLFYRLDILHRRKQQICSRIYLFRNPFDRIYLFVGIDS